MRWCCSVLLCVLLCGFAFGARAAEPGEALPLFSAQSLEGQPVELNKIVGKKPVLLVFWASWCPSCKAEVPKLNRLYEKLGPKGMVFLGINIGANDSPERARAFIQKTGMKYPVVFDQNSAITRTYRVLGVPTLVVADKGGRIVFQGHQVPDTFEQELGKLLK